MVPIHAGDCLGELVSDPESLVHYIADSSVYHKVSDNAMAGSNSNNPPDEKHPECLHSNHRANFGELCNPIASSISNSQKDAIT